MEIQGTAVRQALGLENTGKSFVIARVNLVRAACPEPLQKTRPNQAINYPIVIEKNRKQLGKVASTGYIPEAVVTAGASKRGRLLENGVIRAWAFVEKDSLQVDQHEILSSNELLGLLNKSLEDQFFRGHDPLPGQAYPFIREVFPFENYLTFDWQGKRYGQQYLQHNFEREVKLAGRPMEITAASPATGGSGANKESMPLVQTGMHYFPAHARGMNQSTQRGALNSELMTQTTRNMSDINEAVRMYLDAVKNGLHKPMKPSFCPVNLTDKGKISAALAASNIAPIDFAMWMHKALVEAGKGTKAVGTGEHVQRSKFAYVGDPKDPSTWKLPIHDESHAKNALARINQTQGIPADKKPGVLQKIRRAAKSKGVDVSEPTSGQKKWAGKHGAAA